jgi:ribosomal protein S18 acetylase RimI-like enzyme
MRRKGASCGAVDHPHVIRPIRAADKAALLRFHARLSSDARFRRYHGYKGELSEAELRFLTEVDGIDHVARVAVDEAGEIDAVARVVAPADGDRGEVAVVVADGQRGAGLGQRVTTAALAAFRQGAGRPRPVVAFVQHDNTPALRLFGRLGAQPERVRNGDPLALRLPASRAG